MSQHLNVTGNGIIVKGIGPAFLVPRHHMDVAVEKEGLPLPVIPSVVGIKHVVVLPCAGLGAEGSPILIGVVFQPGGLDEDGVGVHVHLFGEGEQLDLRIIGACDALYHLAGLVPHGAPVEETGDAVPGVVIQETCSQRVPVLVLELDQGAAELGKVLVYDIIQAVALEDGTVLDDLDVPPGLDEFRVHVPHGRVAEKVGVVVEEPCRSGDLPVCNPTLVDQLVALGAQLLDYGVAGRVFLSGSRQGPQKRNKGQDGPEGSQHITFLFWKATRCG